MAESDYRYSGLSTIVSFMDWPMCACVLELEKYCCSISSSRQFR